MLTLQQQLSTLITQRVKNHQKKSSAPFIVAITGPIAVGKSYFSEQLSSILSNNFSDLFCINTDGFIFPTEILHKKSLMHKKGFPETYDLTAFCAFINQLKQNTPTSAPRYSACSYDRDLSQEYKLPAGLPLIFLEGLNIFHSVPSTPCADLIDLTLYLDATEENLFHWYQMRRISRLAEYRKNKQSSLYWEKLAHLSDANYLADIQHTWITTNLPNIRQHIAPYKTRADIIIEKRCDHSLIQLK